MGRPGKEDRWLVQIPYMHGLNRLTQEPEIHIALVIRYPRLNVSLPATESVVSSEE
jgi:hypothetical protein